MNDRASLWISRPGFAEEPFLVAELEKYATTAQIEANLALNFEPALFDAARRVLRQQAADDKTPPQPANETVAQLIVDIALKH